MNNLFKNNLKTKIIAALIAIILWILVTNESNPFTTKTFYNIPVTIENEKYLDENAYTIKNTYRNNIDVTIRGRQEDLDKVRTSDFQASLDFSQIKSVNDKKLVISEPVCIQKNVRIVSYSPTSFDVQLARNTNGSFPVELKSNITMKPGYVLINAPTVSPESLPFYTEESIINSVASVVANLDIKDLDRDTTKELQCIAYNSAGKEISELSGLKVTVKLEVAKEVPVSMVTRGKLAADYVETLRLINPVKALITGPVETLAGISDIKTEQVNIDKITGNFNTSVPLVVPAGVKLVNTPKEIAVNINVEKLVFRDIELINSDISILNATNDGSLLYEIKTDKLKLQLKGKQADVNAIKLDNLKPAVDVKGLLEGTHRLLLNINLPSQVKLMQQAYVEVKITNTADTTSTQMP